MKLVHDLAGVGQGLKDVKHADEGEGLVRKGDFGEVAAVEVNVLPIGGRDLGDRTGRGIATVDRISSQSQHEPEVTSFAYSGLQDRFPFQSQRAECRFPFVQEVDGMRSPYRIPGLGVEVVPRLDVLLIEWMIHG